MLTLFIAVSCNSNDDDPKTDKEKIVGTWKPVKYVGECEGETPSIIIPTPCESNSRTTFNSDGTGSGLEYDLDPDTGNCESITINFTWTISNDILVINAFGENQDFNYFEVSDTTLKFGESYQEDGVECKSYAEFQKVN